MTTDTFKEFIAGLNPAVAKQFQTAAETHTEIFPLASYRLSKALNGGVGRGRQTLLYGNTASGKSTVFMQSIGQWQKEGKVCAYVDAEKTWDKKWSARLGIDNDRLILIQATGAGRIHDNVLPLLLGGIDVLVIDSISMIMPDAFLNEDGTPKKLDDQRQIGAKAKALTALTNSLAAANDSTALLMVSQTTTMLGQTYTQQIPDGGKKIPFASSQIVKLTSSNTDAKQIKGDILIGNKVLQMPIGRSVDFLVEKNKLGPQHRTGSYDLYYDGPFVGIDYVGEVVDEAIKYGIITKGGAWFNLGDQKWQGRPKVISAVRDDPGLMNELKAEIDRVESGEIHEPV